MIAQIDTKVLAKILTNASIAAATFNVMLDMIEKDYPPEQLRDYIKDHVPNRSKQLEKSLTAELWKYNTDGEK